MKKRTIAATVALSVVIVVSFAFPIILSEMRVHQVSSTYPQVRDHVNVPVNCDQGLYLADHHCVSTCPPGFVPGHWFDVSPPADFYGIICMTNDGRPVSTYDLARLQVSADGGATLYSVISDVPLSKVLVTDPAYRGYWSLQVSQLVLDTLPTFVSMPTVRTEIASIGDSVGTFKILQIGLSSVTGNQSTFYPIGTCCTRITIHVGDEVGVLCEGRSEKVARISFLDQKVEFTARTLPRVEGGCPICLSGDTVIDTPLGPVNVKDLTVGMMVWTVDQHGEKMSAPIIRVGMTPVPVTHLVVHLILQDGRELYASPGHPTTDGRTLGQLRTGDPLDGSHVTAAQLVPYNQSYTYDLLPTGGTGFYWANGILLGSTLK